MADTPTTQNGSSPRGGVHFSEIAGPIEVEGDIIGGDKITIYEATRVEIPLPPPPNIPPETPDFIGREADLAHFTQELNTKHLAVISGMPGVGKTALAATLARQLSDPHKIFWHTFHPDENAHTLLRHLAGFLATNDQPNLWEQLERARLTNTKPPPDEDLFGYLLQHLSGRNYWLCLDDLQWVGDDPLIARFIERLQPALTRGEVSLIITARQRLDFMPGVKALPGLSRDDTSRWLARNAVALTDEQFTHLHGRTEGNAQLLLLAIEALRSGKRPAQLLERLAEAESVEQFLLKAVHKRLTEGQRQAMCAVAVLLGYPGTREAIEAVFDGDNLKDILGDLLARHLLVAVESEGGKAYLQHAIVQSFYYDQPAKRQRQALHLRAAEYYQQEEPDALKAARHFSHAGNEYAERAARLVTGDVWPLINRGEGQAVRHLLKTFSAKNLDPLTWAAVLLAEGQLASLAGELELGVKTLTAAYDHLKTLPASPAARVLKVRACLHMGEWLQYDQPQLALEWLERGQALMSEAHEPATVELEATLLIRTGIVQDILGRSDRALELLQAGLRLLPDTPLPIHATAYNNLGIVYEMRGELDNGLKYYQQALALQTALGNVWGMTDTLHNLGILSDIAGRGAEAADYFRREAELADKLGSVAQQFRALLGQGILQIKLGEDPLAEQNLSRAIALARQHDFPARLLYALSSLATLRLRQQKPELAEPLLAEAEALLEKTHSGRAEVGPELYRNWALFHLAQGRLPEAQATIDRSLVLARETDANNEEGISLRVLGQLQRAAGQIGAALASFEKSLALLRERDPYEAARTEEERALL